MLTYNQIHVFRTNREIFLLFTQIILRDLYLTKSTVLYCSSIEENGMFMLGPVFLFGQFLIFNKALLTTFSFLISDKMLS